MTVFGLLIKPDIDENCLVVERSKFAKHVMVSAGECCDGKGRLHVIPDKVKVNAKLCVETLLPRQARLIEDCKFVLPSNFIFQQNGTNAYTAKLAQDFIATNCSEFIDKDEWPTHLPVDYHVCGAMLERYKTFNPKPKNISKTRRMSCR